MMHGQTQIKLLTVFCNLRSTLGFINEYFKPKNLAHREEKKRCLPGCHILFWFWKTEA
jgi:hypothetical protein